MFEVVTRTYRASKLERRQRLVVLHVLMTQNLHLLHDVIERLVAAAVGDADRAGALARVRTSGAVRRNFRFLNPKIEISITKTCVI